MASYMGFLLVSLLIHVGNSEEYCAMYDVCAMRSDGVFLNCSYGSPSVKPDKLFSTRIQALCPTLTGNVCCTEHQFQTLQLRVKLAIRHLGGCPACLRNYLNLFCELSCSPNQSMYVEVISTFKVNGNLTVSGIDYYTSDIFGQGLYNSCKNVKRFIHLVSAGAANFEDCFKLLGKKTSPAVPAPPYSIDFKFPTSVSSQMQFMNVPAYSYADTSLGCSCDDCPDACSSSEKVTFMLAAIKARINDTKEYCGQLAWEMATLTGTWLGEAQCVVCGSCYACCLQVLWSAGFEDDYTYGEAQFVVCGSCQGKYQK